MSNFVRRTVAVLMVAVMTVCIMPPFAFAGEDTSADDDVATVRVYFSISDDSEFLTGNDANGRVMARVPIDVPYVDLAEYGLEDYYRYEAKSFEDGGAYKMPYVIVERPTLLMCFLKALSEYYLGREITASDVGTNAISTSGGPTSLYLLWFFGHYYNFMYFVNHKYPLMAKNWGSTADYILLEDGDEIDVGMFTDLRFNQYGGFAYFNSGNKVITAGDSLDLELYMTRSQESGGSDYNGPMYKEPIRISGDYGRTWQKTDYKTDKQGKFTASFDEAGVYYLSAGPVFKNQPYKQLQCITPPICVVEVKPAPVTELAAEAASASGSSAGGGASGVKVSWEASPGAEGYVVSYVNNVGAESVISTDKTSVIINDADPDDYEFKVKPFIVDKYVAMGEEYKTLRGEAETVTYVPDTDPEEQAAKELAAAKEAAVSVLSAYKAPADYREAEKVLLGQILSEGETAINAASTKDDVASMLAAYKAKVDDLKTDAEYTAEEQTEREEQERKERERKEREEKERKEREERERKAREKREQQAKRWSKVTSRVKSVVKTVSRAVASAGTSVSKAVTSVNKAIEAVKTNAAETVSKVVKTIASGLSRLIGLFRR